jgi:hypothetical protein
MLTYDASCMYLEILDLTEKRLLLFNCSLIGKKKITFTKLTLVLFKCYKTLLTPLCKKLECFKFASKAYMGHTWCPHSLSYLSLSLLSLSLSLSYLSLSRSLLCICLISKSDLSSTKRVIKIIFLAFVNLATPKAAAKHSFCSNFNNKVDAIERHPSLLYNGVN